MKDTLRGTVAGGVGLIATLATYFPLQLTASVSAVAGAVVVLGTYLLIPRTQTAEERVIDETTGITEANLDDVLAKINTHRSSILASKLAFDRLGHPRTTEKVENIILMIDAITDHVKKKPAELHQVNSFAGYHLARAAKIIGEYVDIADGLQTDRIRAEIEKLKGILDVIQKAYEDFYEKLKLRRMNELSIDGEAYKAVLNFEKDQ
jgi:5-bromo-4-chloroindolyl phosphate hydrolysis protein